MLKIYLSTFLIVTTLALFAQTFSVSVNGTSRTYILHRPPGHNASVPTPLVINFHGYTSNAGQQEFYSNMDAVADTAGFMVVYPEGLNNAWNAFAYLTTPDDVAFTSAIIDHVNRNYKVDAARVYACGMSNGGYMSHRLACELEGRIAAIASVTGLLAPSVMVQCNPQRPVPMLQIHGTNDVTVPYNGGSGGGSVDSTVQFWLVENSCNNSATVIDTLPNNNNTDNSYVIRYQNTSCSSGTKVTLLKIVNGSHTWPNAPFLIPGLVTNKDIDGSTEVWKFFASYTHPNPQALDTTTAVKSLQDNGKLVKTYPNPMGSMLNIEVTDSRVNKVGLYDVLGGRIYESVITQMPANIQFSTAQLQTGVYFLRVETDRGITTYKLVK